MSTSSHEHGATAEPNAEPAGREQAPVCRRTLLGSALATSIALTGASAAQAAGPTLSGTWKLVAADRRMPDGSVTHDYGDAPNGLLMVDSAGRYAVQIFSSERPNFANGDKASGTSGEMRDAVMGSSTHFGSLSVDWAAKVLRFSIEDSSFPNWRKQVQTRSFNLRDGVLTWEVPARADGSVPISSWRRLPR